MLTLWTKNGGFYRDVHVEIPLREDVSNAIRDLQSRGKKFYVYCWDSEYEGYCSDMGIIDTETLEEIYIHYSHGQAFGQRTWRIEVSDGETIRFDN